MRVVHIAMEGARILIANRGMMLVRVIALSAAAISAQSPIYTNSEKSKIHNFWNERGRFEVEAPPERANRGPWVVRLSPEGSMWLYNYSSFRGIGKNQTLKKQLPDSGTVHDWDAWVNAKVAYDRYNAGLGVSEADSRYLGHTVPNTMASATDPGPEPTDLIKFAGVAPEFASAVVPNAYLVNFPDGTLVKMADNPAMRSNFSAYRFPQGVMSGGTPVRTLPQDELDDLFSAAGIDGSEAKVMKAVSILEGGFDSVNTYDTGFVSVGLIQFACLSKGAGSLGMVLLREKTNDPKAFEEDFHRFGLDVTGDSQLVALGIDDGQVYTGTAAAHQIIDDKRLVSVFQHAGQKSRAFRVAQLQIAKEQYYPCNDMVTVNLNGQTLTAKVSDIIRSEAGMATLMDRKVNTGKTDPLASVLNQVGASCGCRTVEDLAAHERDVIVACKYRKDYTLDTSLTQPGSLAMRSMSSVSRHGTRGMRQKKTSG
jgi:hypothetical protein